MEKLKRDRWEEFEFLKREICKSYDILGETPSEPFTQDIIRDEPESFVAVNPDNLDELRATKRLLGSKKIDFGQNFFVFLFFRGNRGN